MANPAIGIHNINSAAIVPAMSYATATGYNSQASGSAFIVFGATAAGTGVTVADTIDGSASGNTWSVITPGSGSNPVAEANDGTHLWIFVCLGGTGGTNHIATGATILDASATTYSTSSPLSCPVSTTLVNGLVLGVGYSGGANSSVISATGAGFTGLDSYSGATDSTALGSAYLANASIGSHDPAMTDSHAGEGLAVASIAFKGSGVAPTQIMGRCVYILP